MRIRGCILKSHLIHSRLSFKPEELFLDPEDFKYHGKTCSAMTLLERLGHRQSGETFARMWKLFHDKADKVHGDPNNPLPNAIILITDCAGQLQNGWIVAL